MPATEPNTSVNSYSNDLGTSWNQFWFRPTNPMVLCWLRMLVGVMAFYIVFSYSFDLNKLWGTSGLLSESTVDQIIGQDFFRPSFFNILNLNSPAELRTAHIISLIVIAMFTVGFFSRITSVLTLIILVSYANRAPLLIIPVDEIVSMCVLYLCFAPSGAYLSIDRWLKKRASQTSTESLPDKKFVSANIAQRLIQIHLCLIYLMMAIAKISEPTALEGMKPWWHGEAMYWITVNPDGRWFGFDIAPLIYDSPLIVNSWTYGILLVHLLFPVLVWNRLTRPIILMLALLSWISLMPFASLTPFSLAMIFSTMIFLSPRFFSRKLSAVV